MRLRIWSRERTYVPAPTPHDSMVPDLLWQIETLRWHISRYDALRESLASRASFILAANAAVVAGLALITPGSVAPDQASPLAIRLTGAAGSLLTLALVAMSIRSSINAFISSRGWRVLHGDSSPPSLFYQHSDTLGELESFSVFSQTFRATDQVAEREAALVNLWSVMNTFKKRYAHLRKGVRYLQYAVIVFVVSVAITALLASI